MCQPGENKTKKGNEEKYMIKETTFARGRNLFLSALGQVANVTTCITSVGHHFIP